MIDEICLVVKEEEFEEVSEIVNFNYDNVKIITLLFFCV